MLAEESPEEPPAPRRDDSADGNENRAAGPQEKHLGAEQPGPEKS